MAQIERSEPKGVKTMNGKEVAIGIAVDMISLAAVCAVSYGMSRWLSKYIQTQQTTRPPNTEAKERLSKMLMARAMEEAGEDEDEEAVKEKVQRKVVTALELNEYESAIADDVIDPTDITVAFKDVGGIDDIKAELWDLVVLPIVRPDLFFSESGLVSPPRGILLFGAPGTGKTMLAKAIAKESGATFVNVRLSAIMDKWFGESNKLVSGTFSLARKLAPSVIFIDEIDTFLNQRDSSEGSATTSMKSEFLTLWDGMTSDAKDSPPITVLGATNRPYDVDSAILRRLPRTFEIGLPNMKSREQILNLFLIKLSMTEEARQMIPTIARVTKGYSGSDLKELCKAAAINPIREITKEVSRKAVMGLANGTNSKTKAQKKSSFGPPKGIKPRPVGKEDFELALGKVKKTGETARTFLERERSSKAEANNAGIDMNDLAKNMQMLQMLMGGRVTNSQTSQSSQEEESDDGIPSIN
uniref:AAA+ ATPase domain-containing protein n=1 Tax=Chaetoceros debilis TaxID=122233 RepID=A0A7S3PU04_9STRA|mmetsp:Transcript_13971/g.20860  ORF Transcript_13971/g.20860 Transcript_13971/m.20860 type:complete len:471 (+) Transcript_13971:133-1545(+)